LSDYYHAFLIYTDKNGKKHYVRGGPNESDKEWSAIDDITGNNNKFKVDKGEYKAGTPDYPLDNKPYPSENLLKGDDLSKIWDKINSEAEKYNDGNYKYDAFGGQNSNTFINDLLEATDIPMPKNNDFGNYWTAGFNSDMKPDNSNGLFDDFKKDLGDFLDELNAWLNGAIYVDLYDPLALDLDGDGAISLIADKDGSVYFDHDCDGVAFRSSWVSPNDGILVFDRNGDGLINNGSELFGNFTPLSNGTANSNLATDGFNALSDFDTNSDGIIDINDTEFENLKIWQDLNSNGITDDGELKTLSELEIASINLNATNSNINLGNGNTQISQSSYTKFDGSSNLIADLNFNVDTINRKFVGENEINLTPEQLSRPNIKGTGFLRDLRFASALNENLANLIETYSVATTKQEQINLLDSVISSWAKTNPNYGFNFTLLKATATNGGSARVIRMTPTQHRIYQSFTPSAGLLNSFIAITDKISIINAFSGRVNQNLFYTSSNDIENIINQTNKTYEAIRDYVYKSLLTQTRLKDYLNLITLDINEVSNLTRSSNPNFEFNHT